MNERDWSPLVKSGVLFLFACAYLAAGSLLEEQIGRMVIALSLFPIVAAGWLFGGYGGILAGVLVVFPNILLIHYLENVSAVEIVNREFIIGNALLILLGGITGRVREEFVKAKKTERLLRSRERFFSLLNQITHSIIASQTLEELPIKQLAQDFTSLMEADDYYITRWDAKKQLAIPVASTAQLDIPFQEIQVLPRHKTLTASAFEANSVIVADDLGNTPYLSPDLAAQLPAKSALCAPLMVGETRIGAVIIAHRKPHVFNEEEKRNASQAGEQIALALLNARQEEELKKQLRESEALAKIARALSESERIGLANVLELIAASAKELIAGTHQSVIHTLDSDNKMLTPEAAVGFENPSESRAKMRLGEGIAGQAVVNRETINITDVQTDPRFLNLGVPVQFRSLLVTPIISGERLLGTISVQSGEPHAFSKNEMRLLHTLGIQAAIAIDNARLIDTTRQSLREMNALYHISRGLLALEANELLTDAVDLLQNNLDYYHVQVFVVEPETGDLILKAASGETGKGLVDRKHRVRAGSGIVGYVAETGAPFFTNNVDEAVFFQYDPHLPETRAEMAIPLRKDEKLYGVLDIQQTAPKTFSPLDQQLVTAVADQLSVALHKADLYENLQNALQQEKSMRSQLVQNERLAIMGRLLASVSHELNNPLQAIQNALFLLKEEKGISPMGLKDLEIVLAESERMAGLVERLRDTYRPPQAEDLQPTLLNDIIEDVYALIATHLRKNEVAFEFRPDHELPAITAQPDQIRQVTLNLLMNAVEAMPSGGRLTAATRYLREAKEVLLSVSDTGVGIPSAILPLIFDPFVTNKKRGTGIGLTISHDIVVKHGGRIVAENDPGGSGATFKVWLPIASPAVEAK